MNVPELDNLRCTALTKEKNRCSRTGTHSNGNGVLCERHHIISMEKKKLSGHPLNQDTPSHEGVMDKGCICKGNWRSIVSNCEPLLQKKFIDEAGLEWTFFGVVWGEDDFYYGMWRDDGKVSLLSCVGSIEGFGFKLKA